MQLQCGPLSVEIDIQLHNGEQICRWILTASKSYSGDIYLKQEDNMAIWSFLIRWIHFSLVLVLTVNPETVNTVALLFKEAFSSLKSNPFLYYTS